MSPLKKWKPNQITKCLYVVSEKYCRDKKFYQPHVDSANLFLLQYLTEIFEGNFDISVFWKNVEHVYFIENVRITFPYDTKMESNTNIRTLPNQCNKRNHTMYGYHLIFDIVYRTFTYLDYPDFTIDQNQNQNEMMSTFAKEQIEKEWHKKKELEKKEKGKKIWYQMFPPEQVCVKEIYKNYTISPLTTITGSLNCHLTSALLQASECIFESSGVFCPTGTYRIAPPIRDLITNQDFGNKNNKILSLDVWSEDEQKLHYSTQSITLYYENKKKLDLKYDVTIQLPFCRQVLAVTTIFWALGWKPETLLTAVRLAARKQWKLIYYDILNVVIQNCTCKSQEVAFAEIADVMQKNLNDLKEILIRDAKIKIREQLLPHLGQKEESNNLKAKYLGYLVWKLLLLGENIKPNDVSQDEKISIQDTDYFIPEWMKTEKSGDIRIKKLHRDHLANTISRFIGPLKSNLLRQVFGQNTKKIQRHTKATLRCQTPIRLHKIFKNLVKLASRIQYCMSSGRWSATKDKDYRQQVTQAFQTQNHIAQESHFTYHSTSMNPDGRNLTARQLNRSHIFNLCPSETPENKKCGLTGHSAQSQEYTSGSKDEKWKNLYFFGKKNYL